MDMLFTNTPLDPRTDAKNWRFSAGSIGKASLELLNMMLEARDDIQQKAEQIGDVAYNTAKTGLEYAEKKYWEFEEQVVAKGIGEFQKNMQDFEKQWNANAQESWKQWKEDNWVFGVKWSAAGHFFGGGSVGEALYFDHKGNIAWMDNLSGTVVTDVEVSGGIGFEFSDNATTVKDMEGSSICGGFGGDIGSGPGVNYEWARGFGSGGATSHSISFSTNVGLSPVEVHGGVSENVLKARVNLPNLEGEYHGGILGVPCNMLFDAKKGSYDVDFGFGSAKLDDGRVDVDFKSLEVDNGSVVKAPVRKRR